MVLKPADVRNMTDDEMRLKLEALRKELYELTTQVKSGRVEKPHRIRQAKREVARLLTRLNERKTQGAKPE